MQNLSTDTVQFDPLGVCEGSTRCMHMSRRRSTRSRDESLPGEKRDDGTVDVEVSVDISGDDPIATDPVVVPRRADPPPRPHFPLLGSLAPLGVAVIVWFVLHSPLALVFALLSPVLAVASLFDGKVSGRRARRRNDADFVRRRRTFTRRVEALHTREIEALAQQAPSARSIFERQVNAFTATAAGQPLVRLGRGPVISGIRVEGVADDDNDETRRLRADARVLRMAPVLAPAPARIAVVGAWPLVDALARGYAVQLAAAISPDAGVFLANAESKTGRSREWEWAEFLPHSGVDAVQLGALDGARRPLSSTFVVVAESLDSVPAEATVVIAVESAARAIVLRHARRSTPFRIEGEFVSVDQAEALCERLARQTRRAAREVYELPSRLSMSELEKLSGQPVGGERVMPSSSLGAAIGVGENGEVFRLDLVEQGPHAVVAGTTGSGKSELLVTWVSALARSYDASVFTVLLVDFKGGAAFDPLTALDQCVGLITDLDPGGAKRALSSLRAEIRWRERILRESGARDISDARLEDRLPRLVIVVDEFAAMLSEFPQLHDVFADIAARGRSLGMHLVLCTQRPSGVVRDSLLANCELRLSLRVNNAADSTAIIGSPAASMLSPAHRGRCLVSIGGRTPVSVQIAHTDAAGIDSSMSTVTSIRTPWLPALSQDIMLADVPSPPSGFAIGLLDLPDEQRQPPAAYDPGEHGSLLVLGSSRSGKSTLLTTIAHQAPSVITIGSGVEELWDSVRDVVALCRRRQAEGGSQRPVIVLIDDLDATLRYFESEYQTELVSELTTILRDGHSCSITLVATAQRLAAPLTALAPLFSERILLRFASRQEYIVAEGTGSHHDPRLPPGAGHWRGARLQVARTPPLSPTRMPSPTRMAPPSRHSRDGRRQPPLLLLVVASRPSLYLDRQTEAVPPEVRLVDVGDRAAVSTFSPETDQSTWLVGTPDAWVAAYTTFAGLRSRIPVYFDGCTLSDFRSLTRRRDLPPPMERGRSVQWLLTPDGAVSRFDLRR